MNNEIYVEIICNHLLPYANGRYPELGFSPR